MADTHRFIGWIRRLSEITLIGVLGMLLLADLLINLSVGAPEVSDDPLVALTPLPGVAGIIAVLIRRSERVRGYLVFLGVSAGVSFIFGVADVEALLGVTEIVAALVLTIGVLRWVEPISRAVWLSLASLVALVASALTHMQLGAGVALSMLLFLAWSSAESVGGYLRFQQERRTQAVHSVRRAERLELARELHDLVAHHITGIVVQAQAARTVAEHKPEAVMPALDAITTAGTDALTSMRRLVSVLRAQDDAARSPGVTFADLRILVERFSGGGPRAGFEIGQGFTQENLAPEVMTTLHRVLQESLTNIRRHAPATPWVHVDLRRHEGRVHLRIRNARSYSDTRLSRLGGGFGLVGMSERVEALGGRLWAGPTPDGCWEVLAVF